MSDNADYGKNPIVNYTVIRKYLRSFEHRNKRLKLRRLSVRADMLEQRSKSSGIEFRFLMQADFVLFMRAEIESQDDDYRWWPETLLYAGRSHGPFEIFARSISRTYFDKVKCLLNIQQPSDFNELFESYKTGKRKLPRWEFDSFDPSFLLGFEEIGKRA